MLKRIENHIYLKLLKEDLRKIGINFITAGTIGIFVTHIANLTFLITMTSMWVL